jgi:hypothetical protein
LHFFAGDDLAPNTNAIAGFLIRVGQRQMTDIQLLDEQEVSRRLSVSVNTLRYWRSSGDGPNYVKLGRLVRYDAVALEKFILRNLRVSKARATMEEKHVAL